MKSVEQAVNDAVAKKVLNKIDIEAIATRVAPQIEKAIEQGIIEGFKEVYWADAINDVLFSRDSDFEAFILKSLGIYKPPAKKKKK